MKHIIKKHKKVWVNKNFIVSSVTGGLLLIASLFINYFAGIYATKQASNSVTDVFLTNIPTLNMDFLIVEGAFIFAFFILILMIYEPKGVPFILKSIAIFIVIRAVFVSMTHIGPSPDRAILNDNVIVSKFAVGGELFFSGHTGMPFLLALAFWHNKSLRITFLIATVIAAISVLFGHVHYTIDVFSAPFISYGIFHICKNVFAKDYKLFISGRLTK